MARILVVDDEIGIRELLSEILYDEGHTVELAENAGQARAARLAFRPDLVLLDIWMPDTDGVSLLKEWSTQGLLDMPVVMMSGHATIDTAMEATRIGAIDFLEKPITLQRLLKTVENGLARRRVASTPAAPNAVAQAPAPVAPAQVEAEPEKPGNGRLGEISLDMPLREARDAFERIYFEYHLAREGHSMTRVSERTGLERTHLYRKLKQLGIEATRKRLIMKILIVGAGRVGVSVAENLVSERNDITVVDMDAGQLAPLQEHFDLRTVLGDACQVSVLRQAGADDADLLIACASADAVNLVVCKLARQVFNVPRRIARVRSAELPEMADVMGEGGFCVDAVISPERAVTGYLSKLIEFPEALQMVEFAGGRLSVMTLRVGTGSPLVARRTDELHSVFPGIDARVIDVVRHGKSLLSRPELRVAAGDEALVVVDTQHARRAVRQIRSAEKSVRRVMIAGGGNIGLRVARELAGEGYSVRLIERDEQRCEYLAESLPDNVLVLHGSGTDEDLLESEGIEDMDTWLALTSDDEDNIMSSLLAKRLGARKVIALINRQAYGELMQGSHIDIAISPSQSTMSELLRHVRRGDIVAVHRLRQGMAEALEVIAHGDRRTSKVVGRRAEDVKLPRGARIVALVRGEDQIIMVDPETVIESGDHVIVFAPTRRQIPQVESLFQVSAAFF